VFPVTLLRPGSLVMIGAEVSYVVQNFHALKLERQGQPRLDVDPAVTAVAILTECYRRTAAGEPPATLVEIEQALGVRHGTTQRATDRLVEGGLLAITGPKRNAFVPARREAAQRRCAPAAAGAPCGQLPMVARPVGALLQSAESPAARCWSG
jgi:hypothetical protein